MNNFHEQYKNNPTRFTNTTTGRLVRAGAQNQQRRANRAQNFLKYRDVPQSPRQQGTSSRASSDPAVRLEKWRITRELRRKVEQRKKKPVFKVGIVHHKFYSPIINQKVNIKPAIKVKQNPTPPKRITRATQKRLAAKKTETTSLAVPSTSKSPTKTKKCLISKKATYHSFAPENHPFTVPNAVKGLPFFGRFAISSETPLMSPSITETDKRHVDKSFITTNAVQSRRNSFTMSDQKKHNTLFRQDAIDVEKHDEIAQTSLSGNHFENTKTNGIPASAISESDTPCWGCPAPATFSPYITMSRGKGSARKECRSKMGISRTSPIDIPTKETVMKNLNISIEEEERTAQYFKFILQREVDRLMELCTRWDLIKNEPGLSEDAQLRINQAIGQTNLLIKKKFERFRGLVLDCETGKGEMLVQCKDLQGFWDMVYMEVKDCELRFFKLDTLRSKNWIEDDDIDLVENKKQRTRKKLLVQRKPKITAKSSARSWILERKKILQNEGSSGNVIDTNSDDKQKPSTSRTMATLREQNSRRSMKKSPQDNATQSRTKRKPSGLLKKVQSSKASKNIHSPFVVIKISKMCKTPEIRYDDTISYINCNQTPGKGILKKSEDSSSTDSVLEKSARKVDFNEEVALNEVPTNEDLQNSIDLGRALASIDGYDSDGSDNVFDDFNGDARNVTIRRVEKRLDFEDESFNETEATNTVETAAAAAIPEAFAGPVINFTLPTPSKRTDTSKSSPQTSFKSSSRTSKAFTESNEDTSIEAQLSSSLGPKVLRNRVVAPTMPTRHRRSRKSLQNDTSVLSLNLSAKENDDPQRGRKKISEMETSQIVDIVREKYDERKKRRSSRKSVRFNAAENCSGCLNSGKSAQRSTPHKYGNKRISLLGDGPRHSAIPFSGGDLMYFDSLAPTKNH